MLKTTCIGSWPKPDYVPIRDWFDSQRDGGAMSDSEITKNYVHHLSSLSPEEAEALFVRATTEIIGDQIEAGIDIPTDGEVRRENYIHYHCRHLNGFDFENLALTKVREGAIEHALPVITEAISAKETGFLARDYQTAQKLNPSKPIKVTLPGPLTIMDTSVDHFYNNRLKLHALLADLVNQEAKALAAAGCRYIQVDEPLFARQVADAQNFGFDGVERCFHGIERSVMRVVHICCGYPEYLDQDNYLKADSSSYWQLASDLDALVIDQLSLEDAHCHNNLELLEKFSKISIILGVVAIAKSAVESVDVIESRIYQALEHIDKDRLLLAPDCGLGLLSRAQAKGKITAMCKAVRRVG